MPSRLQTLQVTIRGTTVGMRRGQQLFVVMGVLMALLVIAPGIARADLSWSAGHEVDATGAGSLLGVACVPGGDCTAVDGVGRVVTFNPNAPNASGVTPTLIDTGGSLQAIACPSSSQCTAVDSTGDEITFNPQSPSSETLLNVGVTDRLVGVACPSTTECTAVDLGGYGISFDPATSKVTGGFGTGQSSAAGIACPAAGQCSVLGSTGVITFDPQTNTEIAAVAASGAAIACPSAGACVTVANYNSEYSFNPTSTAAPTLKADGVEFPTALACPSASSCVALDSSDHEQTVFTPGTASSTETSFDGSDEPDALACTSSCVAVDLYGRAATVTGTSASTPVEIDPGGRLNNVACPSSALCVASSPGPDGPEGLNVSGQLMSFNPTNGSIVGAPVVVNAAQSFSNGLACASTSQCTAWAGDSLTTFYGYTYGFSPADPAGAQVEFDGEDPTDYLLGIACPGPGECVAATEDNVDTGDDAVVYNPAGGSPTGLALTPSGSSIVVWGIACPSTAQCTAVTLSGSEITFDPTPSGSVGSPVSLFSDSGTHYLQKVACPSAALCVTADPNSGTVVSFDPKTGATISSYAVDQPAGELRNIACLSTTDCVAVDGYGQAFEGDPSDVASWTVQRISGADALEGIDCPPGGSECIAVDDTGQEFTGLPGGSAGSPIGSSGGTGTGSGTGTGTSASGGTGTSTGGGTSSGSSTGTPTGTPPGFVETVTTSSGQQITLTTALGEEGYAPLDQHLLGGLTGDDIAKLLANGGFSIQIPLTYPAYPGNYSAQGDASTQGIPGYADTGGLDDDIARLGGERSYKKKPAAPKTIVLFKYSHTYTKAGVYKATIRFTAAGHKLLAAAQKAHKKLKVTITLGLTAAEHVPFKQTLHATLKPAAAKSTKKKKL